MPNITLKAIPSKLHRALKSRAKAHHRSLNKEVIATLQAATDPARRFDSTAPAGDAKAARSLFSRVITAKEISSWTKQGRL